jgi:RNA polymerase sigma-70 factor, ECF subfamily
MSQTENRSDTRMIGCNHPRQILGTIHATLPAAEAAFSASKPRGPDISPTTDHPGRGTQAAPNPARETSVMSEAGFAELFEGSARALWCIAVAVLRDHTAAHDVVQDAAMIAFAKRAEFDQGTSFSAWAGQIVRFTALNELRRRQRDRAVAGGIGGATEAVLGVAAARPAGTTRDASLDPKLASALETLDETARACLLMRTIMDMGYREIAAALGMPEGTAMSHVHRSRQTLRTMLAGTHLEPPAGSTGGRA